ncbi:FtsW/RodA/SpoVE family cell cycle protein [Bacillus dakarensis]|uniref:FtsW/RodA/SpoVE family cell cycle protein n=1 Tax=Robertmurraya dakarensis TaxID=1926278 RepID=UPI000981F08F|nr:FtsW/RodA/SpoVE family cell cycle protein [Bacillus dakarensis]
MIKKGERFLEEVTNHIKSKEAKKFVAAELQFHLMKTKNSWIEKGLNEEEAEEQAVAQMGSPVVLGQELNKLHRPRIDWFIVILLVAAMGLGFLPLVALGNAGFMDTGYFLVNKIVVVLLGIAGAFGMALVDYRKFEKLGWLFYLVGTLILLLVSYTPNIFMNGVPYIKIGPVTIESLMALPFFFLAWASFFNNSSLKVWKLGMLFLLSLYLFLLIPNLPAAFIYIVMVFVMLWWSRLGRKRALVITMVPSCLFVIGGLLLWSTLKEYQLQRILGYLHPEKYADGAGYMYLRLKELLSEAGWFGVSGQAEFLPAAHTDLVFASLTYYYGYSFALILVLILVFFAARMLVISQQVKGHYGKLLLVGGITLFAVQFIYNVGMIIGFFPITSISLPFISYGLMPTMFNAFLMGIVLSVYRRKNLYSDGAICR